MRNFVGSFDCIDKLKYALRQPFAQQKQLSTRVFSVSVSAMLVSMRQKNIAQVSILERYFFVSTYQAAGPDTCLAVFVVASLPPCL